MTTIEQLETRNSRTVRRILRKFIDSVDILKFSFSFDRELKRFPKKYNDDIKILVSKTYKEGYIDGGRQIRHHQPLTAAEFKGVEDPLVTEYTKVLIESLMYIAEDTKPVMIADMTAWYEAGWSYARVSKGMQSYFDDNPTSANRMARTMTNDIFNRATERRYEDSGVVDGLIYAAHLDERTSEICRMLNGTIWALGDSDIRRPPQHFNCLEAGTPITTNDGIKNIEDIKVGDLVLTHKLDYKPVTELMTKRSNNLRAICTDKHNIFITGDHPILIRSNGKCIWKHAKHLGVYDTITTTDGNRYILEPIQSITRMPTAQTYNISVEHDESYVANGIIVHNCRSRLRPYFGTVPGKRDYTKDFSPKFIDEAEHTAEVFKTKYWNVK